MFLDFELNVESIGFTMLLIILFYFLWKRIFDRGNFGVMSFFNKKKFVINEIL